MADKEHGMSAAEIKKVEDEYVEQENRSKYYRERDKRVDEKLALLEKQNKALVELLQETQKNCSKLQQELKEREKVQDDEGRSEQELRLTKMLRKEQEARYELLNSFKYKADMVYTDFKLWCLATHPIIENDQINMQRMIEEVFTNSDLFKQFCSLDNSLLENNAFWIKKYIAEKYFGYSYEFNHDTMTWRAKKSNKV